jgi:subtilisin-like proprotein convertase family protein
MDRVWDSEGGMAYRALAKVLSGFILVAGVCAAQTSTFNSSGTITVSSALQASPYPTSPIGSCTNGACITVSGLVGSITDVKLTFNSFNVSSAFNMGILLQAPNGAALDVMSNACHQAGSSTFTLTDSGTVNGHAGTGTNCFTTGQWLATTHHFSGFLPDNFPSPGPGTSGYTRAEPDSNGNTTGSSTAADSSNGTGFFANVFNGLSGVSANGVWRLYVTNQALSGSTTGTIGSWTLTITTTGAGSSTTTTLSSPTPNPSFTSGANSSVTLTATVTSSGGTVDNGSVTFHDNTDGVDIGTGTVNASGVATTTHTFTNEGAHVLVATYTGGTGFAASAASNAVTQQVIKTTTSQSGAPAGTVGFCNTGGITLPTAGAQLGQGPGKPYPSDVVVSGVNGIIQNVKIYINGYTSTNPNVNALMLVGPNGKTLEFMSYTGGATAINNLNLIWDDLAASQALPQTVSFVSGSYKPTSAIVNGTSTYCQSAVCNGITVSEPAPAVFEMAGPAGDPARTLLSQFAGASANGTWKLFAQQRGNPDTATINNWCINFTMTNGTATTTSVVATPNPATTGNPVAFTATVTNTASPGTPINEGSVTFSDSVTGNNLGTSSVVNGQATLNNITNLSEGDHTITASYTGTANFGYSSGSVNLRLNNPIVASFPTGSYKYCNQASSIGIPGNNHVSGPAYPYPSNIGVTHLPGTIKTVEVDFNSYNNLNPQGLQSLLVGPCQTVSCTPTAADTLDFFSNPQSAVSTGTINLAFLDAAANTIPNSSSLDVITSGQYKPFSRVNTNTYASPAPTGPYQYAAPAGNLTPPAWTFNGATTGVFQNRIGNGPWSLYLSQNVASANDASVGSWCLNFTINPPVLAITKSHSGNFRQGDTGKTYTIHVTNNGPGPTGGTTTVVDDLASAPGLTITNMSGTNWTCTTATKTCTSTLDINEGNSFPDITVTVDVAGNAAAGTNSQTNAANVSGGGSVGTVTATDPTTIIPAPDLTISKSHAGNFTQGQTGTYNITVSNIAAAAGTTFGTTAVTDTLPSGWTLSSFSGTGWSCTGTATVTCTSSAVVAGGASFATLSLTVNVPATSPTSVTNTATVSTTGEVNTANNSTTDPTTVIQVPASITATAGTPQSTAVGTAFATALQATVKDAANVVIPNITVTFTAPGTGASGTFTGGLASTTASTNASGIATAATFTANNTAGSYTVAAMVTGLGTPANFSLTNNAGAPATVTANSGTGQSATVNTAFTNPLSVTVTDSLGNPVSGVTVNFTGPGSGAGIVATNAQTNTSGVASATVTANTVAGGPYTVTASVTGATSATFSLTNTAGAAASVTANSGTGQSATVNTAFANPLSVTVRDAFNNPVSGVTVNFAGPGSGASIVATSAQTNASGVASATVTANGTAGGPYTVTASVTGATSATFSLTNTAGTPATVTANSGTGQSATVNTAFASQLSVTVRDASNNPLSGITVNFAGPGSGASIVATSAQTNASGVATATVTANTVAGGPYTVTASVSGATPATFSLTNTAAAAATVTANSGTGQSAPINTAFATPLSVTVRDAFNNLVSGVTVNFAGPGSGASIVPTSAQTNASGVASATVTANGTAGGPYTVTASVSGATPATFSLTNLPATVNVTAQVRVTSTGLLYSRVTRLFVGTVTITNISAQSISGPLQLVLTNLSSGVTLANATGTTGGSPYITVPGVVTLAPGASASVGVQFDNQSNTFVSYTPMVLSGGL